MALNEVEACCQKQITLNMQAWLKLNLVYSTVITQRMYANKQRRYSEHSECNNLTKKSKNINDVKSCQFAKK